MENKSQRIVALLGLQTQVKLSCDRENADFESGIFGLPLSFWLGKFMISV